MSKLKHTAGPWKTEYRKQANGLYCQEVFDDKHVIAEISWYPIKESETKTSTNRKANARLIAAAPEILDCLIQILKNPSAYPFNFCAYAEKCVEKATGLSINEVLEG